MTDPAADRFTAPEDARVFLGRLTRINPHALVRLRPATAPELDGAGPGQAALDRTALWARLPWGVLVTRDVAARPPADATVRAAELLDAGSGRLPTRRDGAWRWPLPPRSAPVVEEIPAEAVREVAAAAAGTLREVSMRGLHGRPVGARMLREALLDHVPIVVTGDGGAGPDRLEVPQRLVQAVQQMGFLGDPASAVRVHHVAGWTGLAARYGTAWLPPAAGPLRLRPRSDP